MGLEAGTEVLVQIFFFRVVVVWSFCPLPKEEVGWEQCLLGSIYLGLYTSQKVAYLSLSLKYFKVLAYCSVVGLVEGGARK